MTEAAAKVQELSSLVRSIAEILRGSFKQPEYGKVILPFVCHLYRYAPPRPFGAIDAELKSLEDGIARLLEDMTR